MIFIGVARVARSELDILDGAAPDGLAGADHPVTPGSRVACAQTAPGPVLLRFDGSAVATRRARDCRGEDAGGRRLGFHATSSRCWQPAVYYIAHSFDPPARTSIHPQGLYGNMLVGHRGCPFSLIGSGH